MGSILLETKKELSLADDAEGFDPELIIHINSVLADFSQLGIGPDDGFEITGSTEEWSDFLGDEPRLNAAKSLMFLRVKMLFDPPTLGYLITSYEKLIEKTEWRLNTAIEEIKHPPTPSSGAIVDNPYNRDATVEITGGQVSLVEIDGVAQSVVSGVFTVPQGKTIKLTYTKPPTWTWF